MNIIDVLNDKKLLGQFLKDEKTWAAWFSFLRAFFALPAVDGDIQLFKQATGRHQWPVRRFSEAYLHSLIDQAIHFLRFYQVF